MGLIEHPEPGRWCRDPYPVSPSGRTCRFLLRILNKKNGAQKWPISAQKKGNETGGRERSDFVRCFRGHDGTARMGKRRSPFPSGVENTRFFSLPAKRAKREKPGHRAAFPHGLGGLSTGFPHFLWKRRATIRKRAENACSDGESHGVRTIASSPPVNPEPAVLLGAPVT